MRFRQLVLQPFASDVEAWASHGWCVARPSTRRTVALLAQQAGLRATLIHRVAHWATVVEVRGLPMLLQAINLWLHGIELTPSVEIGPGLYLAHTTGSVVNAHHIGSHVELQGGITIGQRNADGFPTIEDHALLGAGCRIIGHLTIGARARIGANAVVLGNVPPGCTAIGVPARIVVPVRLVEEIA